MQNKHISILKAFERELDRKVALLSSEVASPTMAVQKISAAYLKIAAQMSDAGCIEEALEIYRKAAQANPDNVGLNYFVLLTLEKLNRVDEAWTALQIIEWQYTSLYEASKVLFLIKARLEYRRGNIQTSRAMLEKFIAKNPTHSHRALALGWLGKLLDGEGEHDAAIEIFHSCNKTVASSAASIEWIGKSHKVLAEVDASLRWYSKMASFGWQAPMIRGNQASPVVLVGFPRSGTTLLDQILNSHPALLALEEKPTLFGLRERFYGSEDKLSSLRRLNIDDLNTCRERYWSNIAMYANKHHDGLTVVDKLPLNIRLLDIYFRLFPEVKIIVALRDPRDVVLSNYMQMFKLNPEMSANLSLASCARMYEKVMGLYLLFRNFIPGNIHEIRYEDLVGDLEGESKKLLNFLGLEWDQELARYYENAKKRHINTPSYDQVTKPIYRDAIERWKFYERHLEEHLPVLQPFVDAFGYSI